MQPWMEQADNSPRQRIDPRNARPLVVVARETRETGIPRSRWTPVLLGDDVIDFMRKGRIRLMEPAVLAPILGTAPNEMREGFIHASGTGAVPLLERLSCLRVHQGEQVADKLVAVDLILLFRGKRPVARLL
jgi:hypothetical protein